MGYYTRKKSYWVLFLLYIGWCVAFIDRVVLSMGSTQMAKELSLSPSEVGLVLSAFYFGFWLMQLPGGWLADRFGARVVVAMAIAMWSLFTFLTGIAWSLTALLVIRFLFGLGEGAYPSASVKNAAEQFPPSDKPRMTSLLMSSNYVGSMIAPLLIAPLILALGWRHAFMVIGLFGIAFVLVYTLTVSARPAWVSDEPERLSGAEWRDVMKNPLLWRLAAVWFGLSLINKGLDSWMPIYLMTERHLDLKAVGVLLPIPYVMAGVATACGGWVMTRFFDGRERVMLMGCALLTALFLYLMYSASTVTAVVIAQSCAYFFKSFVLAIAVALPTKVLASRMVGSGIGVINVGGQAAGFIAPLVIGAMVEYFGYPSAFLFLMAAAAFSAVVSLTIHTRPSVKTDMAAQV